MVRQRKKTIPVCASRIHREKKERKLWKQRTITRRKSAEKNAGCSNPQFSFCSNAVVCDKHFIYKTMVTNSIPYQSVIVHHFGKASYQHYIVATAKEKKHQTFALVELKTVLWFKLEIKAKVKKPQRPNMDSFIKFGGFICIVVILIGSGNAVPKYDTSGKRWFLFIHTICFLKHSIELVNLNDYERTQKSIFQFSVSIAESISPFAFCSAHIYGFYRLWI